MLIFFPVVEESEAQADKGTLLCHMPILGHNPIRFVFFSFLLQIYYFAFNDILPIGRFNRYKWNSM